MQNRDYKIIFISLWSLVFSLWSVSSAISLDLMKLGSGARSLAMGRTAAGIAGDINSMFINPASAAYLDGWGATGMYTSLLEGDIAYTLMGGGYKAEWGTAGMAYLGSGTAGIQVTTRDAYGRIVAGGSSLDYSNSVISLVYAKEIMENLAAGATLKLFNKSFTGALGSAGSGYDMDIGLLWKPREGLTIGVSQQNTLPASIANIKWGTGAEEGIPFNTKIGCTYTLQDKLLIAADLDYASNTPMLFHGGVEWALLDNFDLRAGFDQVPDGNSETATNMTAGIGLDFRGFSFAYAYYMDSVLSVNSAHYFSLSYSMAAPKKVRIEEVKEVPKPEAIKEGPPVFSDVLAGYWAKNAIEALAAKGIIGGYPDGTFRPEKSLSRAELCALLAKAKKIEVSRPTRKIFKDLPVKHWAAPYIQEAVKLRLVSGYPNRTFKPARALTRAEGVLILSRFANFDKIYHVSPYRDVLARHWAAAYISVAKEAGLLDYIKGEKFDPNRKFSRAEAARILDKILTSGTL